MIDTPDASLALGTLIGTMNGVVKAIDEQNKTSAVNRVEFLKVFEGMRADIKEGTVALQSHVVDDLIVKGDVVEIKTWKEDAEPKVKELWDSRNKVIGIVIGGIFIGGIAGASLTLLVEYFKHG